MTRWWSSARSACLLPTPPLTNDHTKNRLYELALQLIREGKAYVCHQTGEEISKSREIAKVGLAAFGWCTRSMDIGMDGCVVINFFFGTGKECGCRSL